MDRRRRRRATDHPRRNHRIHDRTIRRNTLRPHHHNGTKPAGPTPHTQSDRTGESMGRTNLQRAQNHEMERMNLVHRYSEIEYYAETIRNNALPPHLRRRPVPQRADRTRPAPPSATQTPRRGNHRTRRNQRRSLRLRRSGKPITALRTINRHRIQPAKRRRQTRRNHGRLLQASRQQSSRSQHRHLPTRRRHQRQTTHRPTHQSRSRQRNRSRPQKSRSETQDVYKRQKPSRPTCSTTSAWHTSPSLR